MYSNTAMSYQQQIKLYSAIDINRLVLSFAKLLRLQRHVSDNRLDVLNSAEVAEIVDAEMLGASQQVRQVKVLDVITSDNVRIDFAHKLSPTLCTGIHHTA